MAKYLNNQQREKKFLYLRNFFRLIDQPIVRAIIYKLERQPMSVKELWSTILTEQQLSEPTLRRSYVDLKITHMYELGLLIKDRDGQSVVLKLSPIYYKLIESLDKITVNITVLETFVDRSEAVVRKGKLKALMISLQETEDDLAFNEKSTTQQLLAMGEDYFEEQDRIYKNSKVIRDKIIKQTKNIETNDKSVPSNNRPSIGLFGLRRERKEK